MIVTVQTVVTFSIDTNIIIFNFAIPPIGVDIMNLGVVRPITSSNANIVDLEFQIASRTDEFCKVELLKSLAFQLEKSEILKMKRFRR